MPCVHLSTDQLYSLCFTPSVCVCACVCVLLLFIALHLLCLFTKAFPIPRAERTFIAFNLSAFWLQKGNIKTKVEFALLRSDIAILYAERDTSSMPNMSNKCSTRNIMTDHPTGVCTGDIGTMFTRMSHMNVNLIIISWSAEIVRVRKFNNAIEWAS